MATKPPSVPPKPPAPASSATSPEATSPAVQPPARKPPVKMIAGAIATKPSPVAAHVPKTFAIASWTSANEGEKILAYGKSGIGKTTLFAQLPGAVFIGLDDGGRKIHNPLTGKEVRHIPGITGFQDIRDALHQANLWEEGATIVIDTVTKMEELSEPYIFDHFPLKDNKKATAMRHYGWDGPSHLLDTYRLLLTDLEPHIRAGRNVGLLAQLSQITVANAEGLDYLEDGPKLQHNKQYSVRTELCEWSDHVLRIGYTDLFAQKDSDKAKVAKVTGDAKRAIFTGGAQHFIAKSRPINGVKLPPVVSYENEQDNSLWQFILEGAVAQ